jgi:CRISPR-associated protein Cmr1
MPDFMNRYYKCKAIVLDCEVVTPMFLGNASGAAEWRAEPFKALFRAWWRVTRHRTAGEKALFHEEGGIFGAAGDEESSCKSLFSVAVFSGARAVNTSLKELAKVHHEECEKQKKEVDPLLYLAGMGILMPGNRIRQGRSYFPPGSPFTLTLQYPCSIEEEIRKVLALVQAFGAAGGRCRNGWGSFLVKNPAVAIADAVKLLCDFTNDWKTCMGRDYPNALGRDEKRPLLWKSESMETWEEALANLARAYIKVRVDSVEGVGKLNPGENYPPKERGKTYLYEERHLLGVPLTSHPKTGGDSRHSSPLRFFVRKQADGFRGFILHVPHDHSRAQKLANGVTAEKVWEKVHKKLDGQVPAITRAEYKEVLA